MKHDLRFLAASAVATVLLAGGCASTSGPTETIRSAETTAPADLQLTCASEAASRLGVDSTKVLPTASSATDTGAYRVELTADGKPAVCTIDSEGTVLSVEQVG